MYDLPPVIKISTKRNFLKVDFGRLLKPSNNNKKNFSVEIIKDHMRSVKKISGQVTV